MLAARGGLRAGAGRAIVAVPEPLAADALAILPEATVVALPVGPDGELDASAAAEAIDAALAEATVVVVGPALGRSVAAGQVVDADAIRLFAGHVDAARDLRGTVVFTPHPGEALALAEALALDLDCVERATRPAAAIALAQRLGAVVALKGAGTVTSDGLRTWRCDRGNAALATGGSGDVLSGMVAAMLAQFGARSVGSDAMPPAALAALAVEIHARAGDLWRDAHGDAGALAHEIADLAPDAMRAMRAG